MKIKEEDYERMKMAIDKINKNSENCYNSYKEEGLSNERYRWDILHMSGFDTTPLYLYLNDDHIDTALKRITGKS